MAVSQHRNVDTVRRFQWPAFRFAATVTGLSCLAIANFAVAPSLSRETSTPIKEAPADFFRSDGWGRASYVALGWWLSSEFESVEIHHAGFSGGSVGVSFLEQTSPFDVPQVIDTPVLTYPGDWSELHQEIAESIRTPSDQTVFCRTEDNSSPKLCDLGVAWQEPSPEDDRIIFDVVFSGKDSFLLIERELLESLPAEDGASDSKKGS